MIAKPPRRHGYNGYLDGLLVFCNNHLEPRKIVIPAKAGTCPTIGTCSSWQFGNSALKQRLAAYVLSASHRLGRVPAFAGMTIFRGSK